MTKKLPYFSLLLLLILLQTLTRVMAQGEPVQHAYGLIAKQSCSVYSECSSSNPDPKYNYTELNLSQGENDVTGYYLKIQGKDKLNRRFSLPGAFFLNPADSKFYTEEAGEGTLLDSVKVRLRIESMPRYNDKTSYIHLKNSNEPFKVFFSAGTHCGWRNKKEGYSATTTLYLDNPVDVTTPDKATRYSAATEMLALSFSDFYNSWSTVKLQYALQHNGGKADVWEDVKDVAVKPNTTIHLPYWRIVGDKGAANSKYFEYLGKALKFRAVKTLKNGTQSYGKVLSNVVFYPDGLQFSIEDIHRSYCSDGSKGVSMYVKLKSDVDSGFTVNSDLFVWKIKVSEEQGGMIGTCTMVQDSKDKLKYKLNLIWENANPYEIQEDVLCTLMLEDQTIKSNKYCKKDFIIPGKAGPITVKQFDGTHIITYPAPASDTTYHLLSKDSPYAILEITDNYIKAEKRMPYKIVNGSDTLARISQLSDPYSKLTAQEQESLRNQFNTEFNLLCKDPEGKWASFLKAKHNIWYEEQAEGVEYTGTVPSMSYWVSDNSAYDDGIVQVFSPDDRDYYYANKSESAFGGYGDLYAFSFNYVVPTLNKFTSSFSSSDETVLSEPDREGNISILGNLYEADNTYLYEYNFDCAIIDGMQTDIDTGHEDTPTGPYEYCRYRVLNYTDNGRKKVIGGAGTRFLIDADGTNTSYELAFLELAPPTIGKITSITNNGILPLLSKNGQICLYTLSTKNGLYCYNEGLVGTIDYLSAPKLSTRTVDQINYIDDARTYCIFKSGTKYYKRVFRIKSSNEIFNELTDPNKDFNGWKSEFREVYWKNWLLQYSGFRLYGLEVNKDYNLKLIDGDGCSHPSGGFNVRIKVPALPNFSVVSKKAPANACTDDGEVTLKYNYGGLGKYSHGTETLVPGESITIKGLGQGRNTIPFYYENTDQTNAINEAYNHIVNFPISALSTVLYHVTSINKAVSPIVSNGQITIRYTESASKTKTYTLQHLGGATYTQSTTSTSHPFTNLPAGTYNATVSVGGCTVKKESIKLNDNTFSLAPTATSTDLFNGTGSVTLQASNRNGNISWEGVPPSSFPALMTADNASYTDIKPGEYSFTAVIKDAHGRTIKQAIAFTVEGPSFQAGITLKYKNNKAGIVASLSDVVRLSGATLHLIKDGAASALYTGGLSLSAKELSTGTYDLILKKGGQQSTLYSFAVPANTVTVNETITQPKCPGAEGSITLNATGGLGTNAFQYSTNGLTYTTNNTISGKAGSLSYFVKEEQAINTTGDFGNVVTGTISLVAEKISTLAEPEPLSAEKIIATDVSCKGLNNGSIKIEHLRGGNAQSTYKYSINGGSWVDSSYVSGNLQPGTYSVSLYDEANKCPVEEITRLDITEPDTMLIESFSVAQPICELANGSIRTEVSGGSGYYTYDWVYNSAAFGSRTEFLPDTIIALGDSLQHGSYLLTVRDVNGCSDSKSFELERYSNPQVEKSTVTDARCYGDSNGQISIDSVSGSGTFNKVILSQAGSKLDSITALSQSFNNLAMGNYALRVTDVNGCQSNTSLPAVIHQPQKPISISLDTIRPVIAKGTNRAFIGFTTTGGNPGLKEIKLWDETSAEVKSLAERDDITVYFNEVYAGQYTITSTDSKGCTYRTAPLDVVEPEQPLGFTITRKEDARCKAQTGEFVVEGTGGWGNYRYKRATDAAYYPLNTFRHLYAGRYLVSVKDAMGAEMTDTVRISEPKDSLQTRLLHTQLSSCINNGAITLQGQGGTAPYKLVLSGQSDTVSLTQDQNHRFTALSNGHYMVENTDANGCRADIEVTLSDVLEVSSLSFEKTYPSDPLSNDGALKALAEGGQQPFTYQWKKVNGISYTETAATLSGIESGFYSVRLADAGTCELTAYTYLPAVNDGVLGLLNKGDETGPGKADGFAGWIFPEEQFLSMELLKPDGQLVSYTQTDIANLFNAQSNLYLDNLQGGDYHIVVQSTEGESFFGQVHIQAYEQMKVVVIKTSDVSRKNGADGEIKLSIEGGVSPYSFEWLHLEKNSTIGSIDDRNVTRAHKLSAGTYALLVSDKYANTITKQIIIKEPQAALTLAISEHRHQSCKNEEDAYVSLQATGGWGDYQFRHDSVDHFINANDWRDLDVRIHTFYLTDKAGTTDSIKIEITEPEYLRAAMTNIDSVNCKGEANGEMTFEVSGGTAPYRYKVNTQASDWQNGVVANRLTAGEHIFYFTDTNNCVGQDTLRLYMPEPDELLFSQTKVTHTTCNTHNGAIAVAMQGGSAPYTYEWSNIDKQQIGSDSTITNLLQNGYYRLDVYDYHQCHQVFEQTIKPSTVPLINTIASTPVLCYGDSTGTAQITDVTPAEPYAPWHFVWSNAQSGEASTGWNSAMHHVTVIDTNHCESTKHFMVDTPDSLRVSINAIKNAHCYGYKDGYIDVLPQGGVGNYQYKWSNGDTIARADTLSMGNYHLTLTDGNACVYKRSFTITEPEAVVLDLGNDIKICPNNSIIIDGQDFTTHQWSNTTGILSTERFIDISEAADYYLQVTNEIGCFAHDTIALSIGNDALKADFLLSSEAYLGDTLRIYELSNMELDSLNWEYSGNAFANLNNSDTPDYILHLLTLENGMYNVSLQAFSGGCVSEVKKQVEIIDSENKQETEELLGYQEPLIQSLKVAPNPSDGNFSVLIGLREEADVQLSIYNVNQALKINERQEQGMQEYEVSYHLGGLSTGVYLVVVTAENERKQVKMIIQ